MSRSIAIHESAISSWNLLHCNSHLPELPSEILSISLRIMIVPSPHLRKFSTRSCHRIIGYREILFLATASLRRIWYLPKYFSSTKARCWRRNMQRRYHHSTQLTDIFKDSTLKLKLKCEEFCDSSHLKQKAAVFKPQVKDFNELDHFIRSLWCRTHSHHRFFTLSEISGTHFVTVALCVRSQTVIQRRDCRQLSAGVTTAVYLANHGGQ